jgi:hypothetical protein
MSKNTLAVLAALVFFFSGLVAHSLYGQAATNQGQPTYLIGADPCGGNGNTKVNWSPAAQAAITTATTTLLIAAVTSKAIFVCGIDITSASATTPNTLQFEYGTQTTNPCDTGTTKITTVINSGTVGVLTFQKTIGFAENSVLSTPVSQQLCVLTTVGTTPSISVWGTMVQVPTA